MSALVRADYLLKVRRQSDVGACVTDTTDLPFLLMSGVRVSLSTEWSLRGVSRVVKTALDPVVVQAHGLRAQARFRGQTRAKPRRREEDGRAGNSSASFRLSTPAADGRALLPHRVLTLYDKGSMSDKSLETESSSLHSLSGSVERVTFHNEQNGYTVLKLRVAEHRDPVTVTGNFSAVSPGENVRLTGLWTSHRQFGDQFKATAYEITRPATLAGIQKYLGSGLIKGLGPVMAKRIVDHFGQTTLQVIENEIDRLSEVRGVAGKRVRMVQVAWAEQRAIKQVMIFLQGHGVSTHFAVKIFKHYGNEAISVVEDSPYRLAADIHGIGFRTADQIARNLGVPEDSEARLQAGLQYVLSKATDEGHCYLPAPELIARAGDVLKIESEPRLLASVGMLLSAGGLKEEPMVDGRAIFLPQLWHAERSFTRRLQSLLKSKLKIHLTRVEAWLERFTASRNIQLAEEQRQGIISAVQSPVSILTGGPGTGKTTTLRALVALFRAMGRRVLLASPTGRAAQRLSEVAGEEAKTIHRLLEFDPAHLAFKRNESLPLECDVVIIDESSMLDIVLGNNLLRAIGPETQLVLVGDVDQLPSVGPGAVLRDLIRSGVVPVVCLRTVFRQAAESLIVQNAHRVNRGEFPQLVEPGSGRCDCYFIEQDDPEQMVDLIVRVVGSSLPARFGYKSRDDIQVLSPMNRGRVGAGNLNKVLQERLNPPQPGKAELVRGDRSLRVGDKVIQRVNNYKLEVFNGDLGAIEFIDLVNQVVAVRFADRLVSYDYADVLELGHGFAITVHKSQGSEYPVVVIPLHVQHYVMLSRNLLYTALTRAKQLVVLIGTKKAIGAAMRNREAVRRFTGLAKALADGQE
ncbi:MAG: ATP-dependent RecD-like DNA helicase [Acidobacteriota bacterium]